jgi:hypothetical protein
MTRHHDPEIAELIDGLVELRDIHPPLYRLLLAQLSAAAAGDLVARERYGAQIAELKAQAETEAS